MASDRPSAIGRQAVSEMIALQRRIFERQREIIEANESHMSRGFTRYRNEYRRAVSSYLSISGFGALCDAIASSRVAYVADYHTLSLAQKTFVKLLAGIMHQTDNICLATEFVRVEHQDVLDLYLRGKIKERTFLNRIHYRQHWPYEIWSNFKPIFDFAIDRGFPVFALDSDADLPLSRRDRLAADVIAEVAARHADATILVYIGQMHIVPAHLPAALDRACLRRGMSPPERVIVYQNAEEIYWQLARERQEGVEVVKVDHESYCVNNTPPLVQQLSYLHWIRYDEDLLEYGELPATVRSLMRNLGRFLNLPSQEAAKSVRVLIPGDLDLMAALSKSSLDEIEIQRIIAGVEAEQSACIPALNAIYLATLSLNHAAEEAAHYLKQFVSKGEAPEGMKDSFYYYVLNEACGFFGSKVINPKRKTDHQGKLRQIAAGARKRRGRKRPYERAAEIALDHLAVEHGRKAIDRALVRKLASPAVFNATAHILGYILGDRLYYALTSGAITKKTIKRLFLAPLDRPGEALDLYLELSQLVREVKIPRRI
jgi:hypothetical protein